MELTILQQQLPNGIWPAGVSPLTIHNSNCLCSRISKSNLITRKRTTAIHERKSIKISNPINRISSSVAKAAASSGVPPPQLDLTEDNVRQVLADARVELSQLFDLEVGMTGQAELAELDGPFVRISLRGRFWHKRSTVLARLENYLKQRIPEILEVDIDDAKQLDDSPENF